jgi:hypothetical protein
MTKSKGNGKDSCKLVVPKLNRILKNIDEVVMWLESVIEHLPVFHLTIIMNYA